MGTKELDAVRHLEGEFAEAMTRMYAVGNGLAALRHEMLLTEGLVQLPVATAARPGAPSAGPALTPATPQPDMSGAALPAAGAEATPPGASAPRSTAWPTAPSGALPGLGVTGGADGGPAGATPVPWWQREGMVVRLLGVVGAGILLIGVVLLLAFAIQRGYLGPAARVAGAAALALALVGVAHRVHRDPAQAAGGVAIAAAGYATAYLDVMAATVIYDWLPPVAGLTLAGIIAASGVTLARAWNSQLLALICVGGAAALSPVVGEGASVMTAAFLVVLAIASYPAHLGRHWRVLHVVRILPAATALVIASEALGDRQPLLALAVVLAGFDLATTALAARTSYPQIAAVLVASAAALVALADASAAPRWLILAAAAAAYVVVGLTTGRETATDPILRTHAWAGGIGTVLAALATTGATSATWRTTGLLVLALAYAASAQFPPLAGRPSPTRTASGEAPVDLAGVTGSPWLTVCALALSVFSVLVWLPRLTLLADADLAAADLDAATLIESVLVAALALVSAPLLRAVLAAVGGSRAARRSRLVSWTVVGAAGSAVVVSAGVLLGRAAGDSVGGFIFGHGTATLLWAAGAAYLLRHGLRRSKDASLSVRLGLVVAAAAVAKLLLFDLATLEGIVRIIAFIGAGLALLAMGTSYARALDRVPRA